MANDATFNLTADENFFYFDVLQKLLIDEPQNKSDVLNITVVQANDTDPDNFVEAKFTWATRRLTNNTITIKLHFESPMLISSGGLVADHSVVVSLSDEQRLLLVSKTGKLIDPEYAVLPSRIPQLDTVSEGLKQAIEIAESAVVFSISGSTIVQILVGGSLQSILGEVKILQYLVYPMGFNIRAPVNLLQVNSIVLSIVTLDLLPT